MRFLECCGTFDAARVSPKDPEYCPWDLCSHSGAKSAGFVDVEISVSLQNSAALELRNHGDLSSQQGLYWVAIVVYFTNMLGFKGFGNDFAKIFQ